MRINKFTPMDRMSADTNVLTRFLCNGRIVGNGKLKKVPGFSVVASDLGIKDSASTVNLDEQNGTMFRHPASDTPDFSSQTIIIAETHGIYYYNSGESAGDKWVQVSWSGTVAADPLSPNFADVRMWAYNGKLYIASGPDGIAGVLEYINRATGSNNGYFNDAVGYTDWYLIEEELPEFDLSSLKSWITWADAGSDQVIDDTAIHYMMGIYNCNGQKGIYKILSKLLVQDTSSTDTKFPIIELTIDSDTLDKRVTDIDFYGAIQNLTDLAKRPGHHFLNQNAPYNSDKNLQDIYQDEADLDWRFFKRLSINHYNTWLESNINAASVTNDALDNKVYLDYTENDGWDFVDDVLNEKFYIAYKAENSTSWSYAKISDVERNTPQAGEVRFTLVDDDDVAITLDPAKKFSIRLVSKWVLVSGTSYKTYIPWFKDTDLGDPYSVSQEYAIMGEYYPQYKFSAVQDRRVFRLGVYTDEEHKNMLLWSEPDKPQTNPNGNFALLLTKSDEEPMGLEAIKGGLLALYDRSVHYIRMTGEPVQYDAEEGRFEEGCVAFGSVVNVDEQVFWMGYDGIKTFDGNQVFDLTKDTTRDDIKALLASEYSGNSSSYAGIVGGYCPKEKIIAWYFPNASNTIEGVAVNGIGWDLDRSQPFFILSVRDIDWAFRTYDAKLYGFSQTYGVYELFADSPSETSQLVWQSGVISDESLDLINLSQIRARYKDTPSAIKIYADGHLILDEAFGAASAVAFKRRDLVESCEEFYVKYEGQSGTNISELVGIDIELNRKSRR